MCQIFRIRKVSPNNVGSLEILLISISTAINLSFFTNFYVHKRNLTQILECPASKNVVVVCLFF